MSGGITYVKARDREETESILRDAIDLTVAFGVTGEHWPVVFRAAVDLLSAGSIIQSQQVPFDLNALRAGR